MTDLEDRLAAALDGLEMIHEYGSRDDTRDEYMLWVPLNDVKRLLNLRFALADAPDDGMTEPRTEAGRRLFTDNDPMDMLESNGVTWADIRAIEDEAAALDDGLDVEANPDSQGVTSDTAALGSDLDRIRQRLGLIHEKALAALSAVPDGGEPERYAALSAEMEVRDHALADAPADGLWAALEDVRLAHRHLLGDSDVTREDASSALVEAERTLRATLAAETPR